MWWTRTRWERHRTLKELIVKLTTETSKPNISDAFPFLAPLDLLGSRRSFSRSQVKLYKFLDEEFVEPRLATGENHDDVLDDILSQYAKSQLTRSDITRFLAMQKVRTELTANLGSKEFVEESDLVQLPYVQPVVKETLGCMCVFINLWAIGRDPASWPQPEEFMPERFLGNRVVDYRGSDFAFKPFGAGRRVCPGLDISARKSSLCQFSSRSPTKITLFFCFCPSLEACPLDFHACMVSVVSMDALALCFREDHNSSF
ncbi:hypothetical protein PR202_ga31543 [Eleusine coracana subsp. coracana]|uniref:Uncharacterized protein n=1 Tax=Eleusine coracana subsp. coracana TaxID=191504 RepID=A0AAV5DQ85_ELECO|nr:hypothetical protein PR202_ga31543 [Eleusine coracana subsp. coracana]